MWASKTLLQYKLASQHRQCSSPWSFPSHVSEYQCTSWLYKTKQSTGPRSMRMYYLHHLNNFISLLQDIPMTLYGNNSMPIFNVTKNFHLNSKIFNLNLQYHWTVVLEDSLLLRHFQLLWPFCLQSPHRTLTLGSLQSILFLILEDLGLFLSHTRVGLGWTIKKLGSG